jgi:hypothetical protein
VVHVAGAGREGDRGPTNFGADAPTAILAYAGWLSGKTRS